MLADKDRKTLSEAGFPDTDQLLSVVASLLRTRPIYRNPGMANGLSESEEAILTAGGALGVGRASVQATTENIARVAQEYAEMVGSSYTQQEVASLLGVSTGRVRQRLDAGSLYGIDSGLGRVCPAFQFVGNRTLPGLEMVLAELNPDVHPIGVQRFFLSVQPDLISPELDNPLSPRDWLLTGHDPAEVTTLARDL